MKNVKIIETIKSLCTNNESCTADSNDEIYTVVAHAYYYVKPDDLVQFMTKLNKAMEKGMSMGCKKLRKCCWVYPIEDCVYSETAPFLLKVVRECFDEPYFESQIARMEDEEVNDENLIDTYLSKFDETQLADYLWLVQYLSCDAELFMNIDTSQKMTNIFNDRCREIDPSIPSSRDSLIEYLHMLIKNRTYMFDYLKKETIAQIIREHITDHKILAANVAKMIYYCSDKDVASYYAIMANSFQRFYGVNVFEPRISEQAE